LIFLELDKKDKIDNYENDLFFFKNYHHSERAIFKHLENPATLTEFCDALYSSLTEQNLTQQNIKIAAVILDIHSERYLCGLCEEATAYFQSSKSHFRNNLINILKGQEFNLPKKKLFVGTRYSAEKPVTGKHVLYLEHRSSFFSLKEWKLNEALILERDNSTCCEESSHSIATSNKSHIKGKERKR
jgi:hypothetical protein